jgi:quercetin dioxygenase-like cupin family protein
MSAPQDVSDRVGTKLLFENDRVRVWDLRLAPGESTGPHRHATDYLYVVIGDGRLQGIDAEGNRQPAREMQDGEVHFRAVDGEAVHDAVNAGTGPWRNIVIELLEPSAIE